MGLWSSLPEWAKPPIVAALVGALVGALIGEVRHMISWLINRCRTSVDRKVLDFLSRGAPGVDKTVEEISGAINVSEKKVKAGLHRLSDKHQVDIDEKGRWRKVRRGVVK